MTDFIKEQIITFGTLSQDLNGSNVSLTDVLLDLECTEQDLLKLNEKFEQDVISDQEIIKFLIDDFNLIQKFFKNKNNCYIHYNKHFIFKQDQISIISDDNPFLYKYLHNLEQIYYE